MKNIVSSLVAAGHKRISCGLIVLGSSLLAHAQPYPNYIIDQFDVDTTGHYQNQGWGSTYPTLTLVADNASPMAGLPDNPGSGSLQWNGAWEAAGDQIMISRFFATNGQPSADVLNFDHYTNISFDVQFLADSATNSLGNYCTLGIIAVPQSEGWPSTTLGNVTLSSTNGTNWVHCSVPIPTGIAKLSAVNGYGIKIQETPSEQSIGQINDFLIDNVVLGGNQVVPPPPTLSVLPSIPLVPGLAIVAQGGGNQFNRQWLQALDSVYGLNFCWVGAGSTPVTYAVNITSFPDTNHLGFTSQICFAQNGGKQDSSVDYDAANVALFQVYLQANGSAIGRFYWKTNQAFGNSQFGTHVTAILTNSAGALGKWSVTFLNDTNVTITAPGGGSASGNFPDPSTVSTYFSNPLSLYYGNNQGGTTANIGQFSTYSEFIATNMPICNPIVDVFANDGGVINTAIWERDAGPAPYNMLIVQTNDAFWLHWTQPNAGFSPFTSPVLGSGAVWTPTGITNFVHTTLWDGTVLPQSALPGPQEGYIRLVK